MLPPSALFTVDSFPLRCVYTSEFHARFRIKLARFVTKKIYRPRNRANVNKRTNDYARDITPNSANVNSAMQKFCNEVFNFTEERFVTILIKKYHNILTIIISLCFVSDNFAK